MLHLRKSLVFKRLSEGLALVISALSIFGAVELGFNSAAVLVPYCITIVLAFFTSLYIIEIGETRLGVICFAFTVVFLSSATTTSVFFVDEMAGMKLTQFEERYEKYLNQIEQNERFSRKNFVAKNSDLFSNAGRDLTTMHAEELKGKFSGISGPGPTVNAIIDTRQYIVNIVAPDYTNPDTTWFSQMIQEARSKQFDHADSVESFYNDFVKKINDKALYYVSYPTFDSRVDHFSNLLSLCAEKPWKLISALVLDGLVLLFAFMAPRKRVPHESLIRKASMLAASVMTVDYLVSFYGLIQSGWTWLEIVIYMLLITGFGYISFIIFTKRRVSWMMVGLGTAVFLVSAIPDFSTNVLSFAEASKLNAIETHISREWTKLPEFKEQAFEKTFVREFAAYMESSKQYLMAVGDKVGGRGDNTDQAMKNRDNQFVAFQKAISSLQGTKIPMRPKEQAEAQSVFAGYQAGINKSFNLQVPVKSWEEMIVRVETLLVASKSQPIHVIAAAGLVLLSFGGLLLTFRARKSAVSYRIK